MAFPIEPPVEPMLAKLADGLPPGEGWLFEPKWDGFRALVFRDGDRIYTQSRDSKPLDRYFPELADLFRQGLPTRCVVDGEIVIATPDRPDPGPSPLFRLPEGARGDRRTATGTVDVRTSSAPRCRR